ncbi:MAG: hypothetical protein AAB425_01865, partial [Bdellovibrionota bacterium]
AGESAINASRRELEDEIGYQASHLIDLGVESVTDIASIGVRKCHRYLCNLSVPLEQLNLQEGLEMRLVSLAEIKSKTIYSERMLRYLPVVPTTFIEKSVELALALRSRNRGSEEINRE